MIRGIERRKIFRNKKDREDFLDRLSNLLPETETLCYAWAVRELGISLTELARRLGISVAGVGYSVERGEIIARENDYQLTE
jgi:hypothetical protein